MCAFCCYSPLLVCHEWCEAPSLLVAANLTCFVLRASLQLASAARFTCYKLHVSLSHPYLEYRTEKSSIPWGFTAFWVTCIDFFVSSRIAPPILYSQLSKRCPYCWPKYVCTPINLTGTRVMGRMKIHPRYIYILTEDTFSHCLLSSNLVDHAQTVFFPQSATCGVRLREALYCPSSHNRLYLPPINSRCVIEPRNR